MNGIEQNYTQKLDHFDPDNTKTFKQRYFVNDEFGNMSINPPRLIVYIGGESTLSDHYVTTGSYIDLAISTQAFVVGLEHRFFGKSHPFEELTTENLRYLTSDQALADLAQFITFYKQQKFHKVEPTVLVVGGSYPGTLSSYFRLKYPHIANFSWASSPPLWVKNDFVEYDIHCAKMLQEKDQRCYEATHALYDYWNDNPDDINNYITFNVSTDPVAHLSIISDFIAGIVQYDNTYNLLTPYCQAITGDLSADKQIFSDYFYKYLNLSDITDVDSLDDTLNTNTSSLSDQADMRSWTWMTCNEFGWYQVASGLLRPSQVNLTYSDRICQLYFNVSIAKKLTDKALVYGGQYPKSTMIYFSNGKTDPWSELSVYDNVSDPSVGRFSTHIDGASHCSDLHSQSAGDSDDLIKKRNEIVTVMQNWLTDSCNSTCVHGQCIMGQCVCDDGYFGETCKLKHVTETLFRVFTTLVVVLPTLMMIIIGCSAWFLFKKDREDADIRTIP